MARTPSTMLALGTRAPDFMLEDVISKRMISLKSEQQSLATVIMFICNHCPFVKHVQDELVQLAKDYGNRGVRFIAINSNDVENYPDDSPENMRATAASHGYTFPYLFDDTQEVAKAYHAACTPDFFIFDEALLLVYRGQLDDSRPGNGVPVTGESMRQALDCILAGKNIPENQKPSLGCNIKWKPA